MLMNMEFQRVIEELSGVGKNAALCGSLVTTLMYFSTTAQ